MTSGKWMVLDSQTREVYGVFQDGRDAIQTAKFSPDGKMLALGSHDGIIYMYQVSENSKKYRRLGRCLVCTTLNIVWHNSFIPYSQGHSSPVTHLDWSNNSNFIQSNSRQHELLFCMSSYI